MKFKHFIIAIVKIAVIIIIVVDVDADDEAIIKVLFYPNLNILYLLRIRTVL